MDRLTGRLPPDLIKWFDAAAAGQSGRSRLLRRLIQGAAHAAIPAVEHAPQSEAQAKLTLRFDAAEAGLEIHSERDTEAIIILLRRLIGH